MKQAAKEHDCEQQRAAAAPCFLQSQHGDSYDERNNHQLSSHIGCVSCHFGSNPVTKLSQDFFFCAFVTGFLKIPVIFLSHDSKIL